MYITRIVIDSLWEGKRHVDWCLDRHVNILSGVNGVGKSTILTRVIKHLRHPQEESDGVTLTLSEATSGAAVEGIRFDVIRSIDRPVLSRELIGNITSIPLLTELDVQLYQLQRQYLDYQVNLSNRMLALFTAGAPDAQQKAAAIAGEKTHFFDLVDSLFGDTHKTIVRDSNEVVFSQDGSLVTPLQLSSGEKQMLIILLTVLVENRQPCVLLMDEPEVSLHIEWQQRLIALVLDLNPEAQIILTTHSPAVIMDGWTEHVTDVEDIVF